MWTPTSSKTAEESQRSDDSTAEARNYDDLAPDLRMGALANLWSSDCYWKLENNLEDVAYKKLPERLAALLIRAEHRSQPCDQRHQPPDTGRLSGHPIARL